MALSLKNDLKFGVAGNDDPIDAVLPINASDDLYESESGEVWLKSGVIETDTSLYPDAKKSYVAQYQNEKIDGSLNSMSSLDISSAFFNNNSIYYTVVQNRSLYKVEISNPTTTTSIPMPSSVNQSTSKKAVGFNGNIIASDDLMSNFVEFDYSGSETGVNIQKTTGNNGVDGLTSIGDKFYVLDRSYLSSDGVNRIFEYDLNGGTGRVIDIPYPEYNLGAIGEWGGFLLLLNLPDDSISLYNLVGENIESTIPSSELEGTSSPSFLSAFEGADTSFWVTDADDSSSYKHSVYKASGLQTVYTDPEIGLPYYVRVK